MLLVYLECETFINKKYAFFKDSIHVSLLFLSIKSFSLFSKMSFEGKINLCAFVKCSLKVVYINHITIFFFFLPISKSYIIIFCCNCFCYIICKSNEIVNLFNNCFEEEKRDYLLAFIFTVFFYLTYQKNEFDVLSYTG